MDLACTRKGRWIYKKGGTCTPCLVRFFFSFKSPLLSQRPPRLRHRHGRRLVSFLRTQTCTFPLSLLHPPLTIPTGRHPICFRPILLSTVSLVRSALLIPPRASHPAPHIRRLLHPRVGTGNSATHSSWRTRPPLCGSPSLFPFPSPIRASLFSPCTPPTDPKAYRAHSRVHPSPHTLRIVPRAYPTTLPCTRTLPLLPTKHRDQHDDLHERGEHFPNIPPQ